MDRETAAKSVARSHFEIEPQLRQVVWVTSGPPDEIRLVEVNPDSIRTSEFIPLRFRQTHDIPFFTVVAEVTPDEWEEICSGKIATPDDWDLSAEHLVLLDRPGDLSR